MLPDGTIPLVSVIDDDLGARESIRDLLESVGMNVRTFGSPKEFMEAEQPDIHGCLVLDVRMPGKSGLELQRELVSADIHMPIIFLTAYADVPTSVRALKAGAFEFLTKPCSEQELLDAIQLATARDRARRDELAMVSDLRTRFETLSAREREVMKRVVQGLRNKQVAYALEISEITVKQYRGSVMKKMQAPSLADLVRMADRIGMLSKG